MENSNADVIDAEVKEVTLNMPLPAKADIEKTANAIIASAQIKIDSPMMYEIAADELKEIQVKLDNLVEQRMTLTRPLDASKKGIMDLFRDPTERCENAIKALKEAMLAFQREERVRQQAEQKRLEEIARKERIRLEQEALARQQELDRKAREAEQLRQQVLAAEQKALAAAAAGDAVAEEKAAAEALHAQQEQARANAEAQAAQESLFSAQSIAAVVSAPAVISHVPKVHGVSTSAPWTAEVTDKLALIRFVAANPQYVEFLDVNMVPIRQQAKSLKEHCKIDGVRVFQNEVLTSRRK